MKVTTGNLWIGKNWKDAIQLSIDTPDCGVEPVYKIRYEQPNSLLSNYKGVLVGYQIYGYDSHRKYKTRIPKKLNEYTKNLLSKIKNKKDIKNEKALQV